MKVIFVGITLMTVKLPHVPMELSAMMVLRIITAVVLKVMQVCSRQVCLLLLVLLPLILLVLLSRKFPFYMSLLATKIMTNVT